MLSSKRIKGLIITLSLLIVTTANGAPTLSDSNGKFAACSLSPISDVTPLSVQGKNPCTESYNSYLAGIAVEFFKPPISFKGSPSSSTRVKPLPPIPGALLMAITGFLCVSFVKDRKLWLAALAGLLWLGQTGFSAFPHLVSQIASKKQIEQQHSLNVAYARKLNDSTRLRSDIEETQYIGLLHHLAGIPDGRSTFTYQKLYTKAFGYLCNNTHTSLLAVIFEQYSTNLQFNCLASRAKQPVVCFSPAFTFANIPRGPPKTA